MLCKVFLSVLCFHWLSYLQSLEVPQVVKSSIFNDVNVVVTDVSGMRNKLLTKLVIRDHLLQCSFTYRHICLPVYLSFCLSAWLSTCLSSCLPFCLSVCLSACHCLPVCLSWLSFCLPVCLPACHSVILSVCSDCQSIWLSWVLTAHQVPLVSWTNWFPEQSCYCTLDIYKAKVEKMLVCTSAFQVSCDVLHPRPHQHCCCF